MNTVSTDNEAQDKRQALYRYQRQRIRRLVILVLVAVGIALPLTVLVAWLHVARPDVLLFGFVSFTVMGAFLMAGTILSAVLGHWILRRDYGVLLKECYDQGLDREHRLLTQLELHERTSRHAGIRKLQRFEMIWATVCFALWVASVMGVLVAGLVFQNTQALRLLSYFK